MSDINDEGQKKRARDEDLELIKVEQPPLWEAIDRFVFAHLKRGLNYDMVWMSSTKLGNTVGVWGSRPFNRPAYGSQMLVYLKALREKGVIKWEDKVFLFTHEKAMEARERYIELCCAGELKITTSWGPNTERAVDKSRFHKMVPQEIAEKYGLDFETLEDVYGQSTYMGDHKPENLVSCEDLSNRGWVVVTAETIKNKYSELYGQKSSTGYVKKAEKIELVKTAMSEMEDIEDYETAMEARDRIAGRTKLKTDEVEKLLKEIYGKTTTEVKQEEIQEYDEPDIDLDQLEGPSDTDLAQVDQSALDLAEEIAEATGLEHTEEFETPDEVVTAAVTAVEETVEAPQTSMRALFTPDDCFENQGRHKLRIGFADSKLMDISSTDYEGINVDDETQMFFVEGKDMPWEDDTRTYLLQEGTYVMGDPKTGETHVIECTVANL